MKNMILEMKLKQRDGEISKYEAKMENLKPQVQQDTNQLLTQLENVKGDLSKMTEQCEQKDSEIQGLKEEMERRQRSLSIIF